MRPRLLFAALLCCTPLVFVGCNDDDDFVVRCVEATVVGRQCQTASGSYGYVLNLAMPNGNAAGWVDSVGNQYSFTVTAINLPGKLREAGKKVYFTAHQATSAEITAELGPRTAQCSTPPPLVFLEVVQDKPCN